MWPKPCVGATVQRSLQEQPQHQPVSLRAGCPRKTVLAFRKLLLIAVAAEFRNLCGHAGEQIEAAPDPRSALANRCLCRSIWPHPLATAHPGRPNPTAPTRATPTRQEKTRRPQRENHVVKICSGKWPHTAGTRKESEVFFTELATKAIQCGANRLC